MSKTYQWVDKTVEYICECLALQNKRLQAMTDGDGGFFVDMYISTDSEDNQNALQALSANTSLLYTYPSPRDVEESRMTYSA